MCPSVKSVLHSRQWTPKRFPCEPSRTFPQAMTDVLFVRTGQFAFSGAFYKWNSNLPPLLSGFFQQNYFEFLLFCHMKVRVLTLQKRKAFKINFSFMLVRSSSLWLSILSGDTSHFSEWLIPTLFSCCESKPHFQPFIVQLASHQQLWKASYCKIGYQCEPRLWRVAQGGGSHALWWKRQRPEQVLVWSAFKLHVETAHDVQAWKRECAGMEEKLSLPVRCWSQETKAHSFTRLKIFVKLVISSSYLKGLHKSGQFPGSYVLLGQSKLYKL